MSNYNLSEGLEDHFTFEVTLEGKTHSYSMKYPSTKQLLVIRSHYDKLESIDKDLKDANEKQLSALRTVKQEELKKEAEKEAKALADDFTNMFTASEGSMPIGELLEILPTNMRAKFDQMIQKEIGGGEAK